MPDQHKHKRAVTYCCNCKQLQSCELVSGCDIYGSGTKYDWAYFFRCPDCGEYVGASQTYEPLGTIPTKEIRALRSQIHAVIDPIWKSGRLKRGEVYKSMAKALGILEYHTAELSTPEIALQALEVAHSLKETLAREGN